MIGIEDLDSGTTDAGDELDAGAAVDAGAPDAGPRDAGPTDAGRPFDLEQAVRTCERIESCMLGPSNFDGLTFLNACISFLGQPVPDDDTFAAENAMRLMLFYLPPHDLTYLFWLNQPGVQRCLHEKTSCEDVFSCFNEGATATRCNPNAPATCEGTRLVTCQAPSRTFKFTYGADGGFRTFSHDCGAEGRICAKAASPSEAAGCAPAQCSATTAPVCMGNVAYRCLFGLVDVLPCPDGFSCVVRSPPDAVCGGASGTCTLPATRSHCENGKQVSCQFGAWATTSCAEGLSCNTAPNGVGFCGVAGECDPSEDLASCDQTTGRVRVCALGRWMHVDCPSLGFGGCIDATVDHPALCQ